MSISKYLDDTKSKLNIKSDAKLGLELGLTRSAVSLWRTGRQAPDDYACFQIANILMIDPRRVIADARFEVEKNPERREFWEETRKEYGGTESYFLFVILSLMTIVSVSYPLVSYTFNLFIEAINIYYVK